MSPARPQAWRTQRGRPFLGTIRRLISFLVVVPMIFPGCAGHPSGTNAPISASPPPSALLAASTTRLLVRSWTCLMCIYSIGTMVFEDGLVVQAAGDTVRARHLGPAGITWVRARLDESPLAAGAATFVAVPAPGAPPERQEHTVHRFAQEIGGTTIRVDSDVVGELAGGPGAWVIPDEMLALERLSADLESPDAWVPPDLWTDAWAPYRPERFLLIIDPLRNVPPEDIPAGPDADAMPWPFLGRIDQLGTPRLGGDPQGERCLVVGEREVERLTTAEAVMGIARSPDEPYVSNVYAWKRGNGTLLVATRWLLPNEPSDCGLADRDW